jgi:hypothetical protein
MHLRHLTQCDRHLADGWRRIAAQRLRLADMDRRGHDTSIGDEMLAAFLQAQTLFAQHRDLIIRELAEQA